MTDAVIAAAYNTLLRSLCRLAGTVLLIIGLIGLAVAQTSNPTNGSTPLGLAPGAPSGSYGLSGFDNVSLYSGSLNFRLPIMSIGGRGGAGYTMMLPIEQHWTIDHYEDPDTGFTSNTPNYNFWDVITPGYSPGVLQARYVGFQGRACSYFYYNWRSLTRLTFTAADGTEYELVDPTTGGAYAVNSCQSSPSPSNGYSRGKVFVSNDGSGMTFISDAIIRDPYASDGLNVITSWADNNLSGYLLFKDGTRYRIDGGMVSWIRDRNGNKLTFTYNGGLSVITDSLNRQVTIAYNVNEGGVYGVCDKLTFKGFGGATRTIRISRTSLSNALKSGYSIQTDTQLFGINGAQQENPTVVSSVWLPDTDGVTRRYRFYYNSYAELARVELPTGGAYEYDWAPGLTSGNAYGTFNGSVYGTQYYVYRRVTERRVLADGVNVTSRTTFGRPESTEGVTTGYVTTDEKDGSGTLLARQQHYFYGTGAAASMDKSPIAAPTAGTTDGKEYQTDAYDANGTTLLRRVVQTWEASTVLGQGPHVNETDTTLSDTNQVAKKTFAYDGYGNQTDVYEYDYGTGAAGALIRRMHTDFLTTNSVNGAAYNTVNPNTTAPDPAATIHIRSLPTQQSIYDASGTEQARTTYEYDNYTPDTNHAALIGRTNISGLDAAFTTSYTMRGNVTRTAHWLLATNTPFYAYAQYDQAGSVVKTIDQRGYATTIAYTDCFGAPNGEAHTNTAPTELGSAASYAFATSTTNAQNQTEYIQYDYYLGRPVDAEDANGVIYSGYSTNDVLDRPTKIISAVNTTAQSQTVFSYDDVARTVTTTSDLNTFTDGLLKGMVLYDGLGRTTEARQYETATAYITTKRNYDALGRAYQVSNPYRAGETVYWTTTAFDALGRAVSVTTPDNAVASTAYSGNAVTATDQAGKQRKSVTDALGRLSTIYEDPTGLSYQTSYAYDVLDDLLTVTQGSQTRTFVYDSLKRLTSATNPESGTISYTYDPNGNLLTATDARNITTTYAYDALNRNITVDYSDTTVNPDINRYYDNPTTGAYGKGRFWYEYAGGITSGGQQIEHRAVDSYDAAGRPTVMRQMFMTGGAWDTGSQVSRTYDLAGHTLLQTYPSGRVVNYQYDNAGRMTSFTGNLGDGITRTYTTGISYHAAGQLKEEQFGTQTPLYHKQHFNVRQQLYDIRLSTVAWATDQWNWNRGGVFNYFDQNCQWGASDTANNGNIKCSESAVPLDPNATYAAGNNGNYATSWENYAYDSLNRLTSDTEQKYQTGGALTQVFQQSYAYDRWGNRTIDQTHTSGLAVTPFTVDTTTNRLLPGGTGTMSYDAVGNLTMNTYNPPTSGAANFIYDAGNRMTEVRNGSNQTLDKYTYDAEGKRTRRIINGVETWQVYGFDGELLAEYAAGTTPAGPQKEYGYRNGEMLVTVGRTNVAAAANGGTATASSNYNGGGFTFTPAGANDGDRRGANWGTGGGWNDAAPGNTFPDWWQVDFNGSKTINEIDVFTAQDNWQQPSEPTETMTFSLYGLTGYEVQYWTGSAWADVPNGSITGNNKVWRKFTFTALTTSKIRVLTNASVDGYSRITEVEAYAADVEWLVADQLGTARMVADETGSLGGIKRHDYLPFGEELFANTGGRTTAQGYSAAASNNPRQHFTGYERDDETGLDFAQARYYANVQGRFTSPDPLLSSGKVSDPQSWNRYTYAGNNPEVFTDPTGLLPCPGTLLMNGSSISAATADRANNDELAQAEALYEDRLAVTLVAVAEADWLNHAVQSGQMDAQTAAALAAANQNLAVEGEQAYSNNSTMVTVWDPVKNTLNPSSAFGHVSYITMQNDRSYSWPLGITHPSEWDIQSPSAGYTDARSHDSAGRGYILDFGPKLNEKFQNALIHAYDKDGGSKKHIYTIWNYNCGKAFNMAINAIRGDLRKQFHVNLPKASAIRPSTTEAYIQHNLQQFTKACRPFPL